jgi:putative serine/threonine protein kinase
MEKISAEGQSDPLRIVVPVDDLSPEEHGVVLCYPGLEKASFTDRVRQLRELGVSELIFEGSSKVGRFGVIGRGCVSIVVKAKLESRNGVGTDPVALKIRRVDANRPSMERDHELQKYANSFGVGPRAFAASKDLFAMEFVDAMKIGSWFQTITSRTPKKSVRPIVRKVLEQCYLLDVNHLDHGELSNPSKHVLIRKKTRWKEEANTVIIDYESASRERRPSNLTAVAAFLLLGGWQSEKIRRILGRSRAPLSRKKLIDLFGAYKDKPYPQSFERIAEYLRV